MSSTTEAAPGQHEIEDLRTQFYNATLVRRIDVHEDLALFRVKPDEGVPKFNAGQYVTLGLGYWESRVKPSQDEHLNPKRLRKTVKRAYSIACPMLDESDNLAPCSSLDYLEFYITLVRQAAKPPALTPRLFQLVEGDRLFAATRVVGSYVLEGIGPEDDVIFLGTGTGEAPHNSMVCELLNAGHSGKIVSATCVRLRRDLGYVGAHGKLEKQYPNYKYLQFTTRENENMNPGVPGYVGKQHLQGVVKTGVLQEAAGVSLDPSRTHVFLCGNPAMIGYQPPGSPPLETPGMLQVLEEMGFNSDGEAGPGNIRFEKYW